MNKLQIIYRIPIIGYIIIFVILFIDVKKINDSLTAREIFNYGMVHIAGLALLGMYLLTTYTNA